MGKLTRSRVLWDGAGLHGALSGGDGVRQNPAGRGQRPHPLDPPHPIAIPTYVHGNKELKIHYLRNLRLQ